MLITLAGPDGAGKSTQAKLLATWLTERGCSVKVLDKWAILDSVSFPECRFIKSSLNDIRICISQMESESRALFLFWSIFQTMNSIKDLHSKDNIYISDGYWIKHAASEIIYGNNEEWITSVTSAFPHSDVVFYFDITADLTAKRKNKFTPYECGRHEELEMGQFLEHQFALKEKMDKWSQIEDWKKIDATRSVHEVFNELSSHLIQELNYD